MFCINDCNSDDIKRLKGGSIHELFVFSHRNRGDLHMSKRKNIKFFIAITLIVLNFILFFNETSISSSTWNIIYAALLTVGIYLVYDDKLEDFEARIKRLEKNLDTKIFYDSVHDQYTYYLLGDVYKRGMFLEMIKFSCDISTRKAEKIVKHFEKESRGSLK